MSTRHMGQERRRKDDEALCGAAVDDNLVWSRDAVTCWKCVHLLLGRPIPPEPTCNEHDKLKAAKTEGRDATQLIGEFLNEFLPEEGVRLCRYNGGELYEIGDTRTLLSKFFGINTAALDAEKDAILEYQRALNKAHDWVKKEGLPHLAKNP